jgi:hypothetical protein
MQYIQTLTEPIHPFSHNPLIGRQYYKKKLFSNIFTFVNEQTTSKQFHVYL